MMKTFTSIIFLVGLSLNIYAQTALTYNNHAIKVGNSHQFNITEKVNAGSAGPNQTWDFSKLVKTGEMTSLMLNPSETTSGGSIPEANAAIKEYDNIFYFKVTDEEILDFGFASCGNVYKYDKPLVKIKFPFLYGSVQQGEFQGALINKPEVKLNGTYKIEADAYGKLLLPNISANNVIRLKSTRTEVSGNSKSSLVTYRWYTAKVRYPLLTVIMSENGGSSVPVLAAYYAGSSQKEAQIEETAIESDNITLSVYPVPFSEELTIDYTLYNPGYVKMELLDNSGKPIKTMVNENLSEGQYKETISGKEHKLALGVYFIRVVMDGKVMIKKVVKI